MSAVIDRKHTDPTDGLELVTGSEVALEATRHLFLVGDLLDPARRKDIALPQGGEELPNRCLRRTGGLLPRCEITPLEFWGEPLPLEYFPEGVRPYRLKEQPAPENLGISNKFVIVGKPLYFMPLYPGDLIVDAIGIASGERRGIVEIGVLRGTEFGQADREMQELFFGNFPLPIQLRLVRQRIETVAAAHADPDVQSVATDMLTSCDQFREYAEDIIGKEQTQLSQRVHAQGHVYRLTPKARSFMDQLEIKPPTDGVAALQDSVLRAVAGSGISPDQLAEIMARQGEMMATATANAIKEAIAAAQSVKPAEG